jgi:hypothetical protein
MNADISCPHCGQLDQVRHVPEEYRRSRSSSEMHGWLRSSSGSRLVVGRFGGGMTTTTPLTRLLAPPSLPARPRVTVLLGLFALLLIMVLADMTSAHPVNPRAMDLVLVVIFGALPVSWLVAVARSLWQRAARRQLIDQAGQLWHRCWYCGRCGRAFLGGEDALLPAGRLAPTLLRLADDG